MRPSVYFSGGYETPLVVYFSGGYETPLVVTARGRVLEFRSVAMIYVPEYLYYIIAVGYLSCEDSARGVL